MQKQLKTLGISIGVLLLLLIGFFAVKTIVQKVEETEELRTDTLTLWSYPSESLENFWLERLDSPYSVARVNGILTIEGFEDLPRDEHSYAHLEAFENFSVLRKLENGNPSEFGLSTPPATLHFTFLDSDGTEISRKIALGNSTSDGSEIYIQMDDELYMASLSEFTSLLQEPTAYVSKNVAPYSANPSAITFRETTFSTGLGGEFTVGKTPIDNSTSISSGYSIVAPVEKPINLEKVSELSQAMLVLQGEIYQISPTTEQLEAAGLLSPSGKMEVHYAVTEDDKSIDDESLSLGEYTILLGNYIPEERAYYVQLQGTPIIYKVLEEAVPWANYTIYSLMSMSLLDTPSQDVASIEVTDYSGTTLLILSGENPRKASIENIMVEEDSFSLYYQLLLRGAGSEFISKQTLSDPYLTITFTFEASTGRSPLILTFTQDENQNFIVQTSDPDIQMDLLISREYVKKMITSTQVLKHGEVLDSIAW